MAKFTVTCPHCESDHFTECSVAPVIVVIHSWGLRDGRPYPSEYGSSTVLFEAETLDAKPYCCTNCAKQFTADQLIVVQGEAS